MLPQEWLGDMVTWWDSLHSDAARPTHRIPKKTGTVSGLWFQLDLTVELSGTEFHSLKPKVKQMETPP